MLNFTLNLHLREKLVLRTEDHTINIRYIHTISIPRHDVALFRCFSYNATVIYNDAINGDLKKYSRQFLNAI